MLISLDTETGGVDLYHLSRPFLVTICNEANDLSYWEWDVNPLTRLPIVPKGDLLEITDRLEQADEVVFQNAKYDITALVAVGIKWKHRWWRKVQDTLYSGHILASAEPHDLTTMALRYLGLNIQPYEEKLAEAVKECRRLVMSKAFKVQHKQEWLVARKGLPQLPSIEGEEHVWSNDYWLPRAVAKFLKLPANHQYWNVCSNYANVDSGVTLPLWLRHKELLEQRGYWKLYLERRKLIKIIYEMESRGVTYSSQRWEELVTRLTKEELESEKTCIALSGGSLKELPRGGTSNALRHVVFNKFKLTPVVRKKKKSKTNTPSVDKVALEVWSNTLDPKSAAGMFIKTLRVNRGRNTAINYANSYKRFGIPVRGQWVKLHPSLNATGSYALRFSSSNPNEQNISKLSDSNLRYLFGPMTGREWWSLDYSNLELTIPAYEASEMTMVQLFERPHDPPYFGSQHLLVSHILYPKEFEECLRKGESFKDKYKASLYQWTKNGDFAVTYGAMAESGTADLAYHMPGAQKRIEARFTEISKLNQKQIAFAYKHGYVLTMPDKEVGPYPIQSKRDDYGSIRPTTPLNNHVQGTAMWCMCRAMVRVAEYLEANVPGGFITMQVHDELVLDLPCGPKRGSNLAHIMEVKRLMELSGDDIGIPLRVDYSFHPNNWAKSEDPEEAVAA